MRTAAESTRRSVHSARRGRPRRGRCPRRRRRRRAGSGSAVPSCRAGGRSRRGPGRRGPARAGASARRRRSACRRAGGRPAARARRHGRGAGRSRPRSRGRGEGVAEVERAPHVAVVGVAEADRGLEGRAAADELRVGQLPERLAGEQPRLHDLGHPVQALGGGQRRDQGRVDDRLRRPVEGADEVLSLREVDRGLAADAGVDLADEGRGIEIQGQPRRNVAAAKPAVSVSAPPPSASSVSPRRCAARARGVPPPPRTSPPRPSAARAPPRASPPARAARRRRRCPTCGSVTSATRSPATNGAEPFEQARRRRGPPAAASTTPSTSVAARSATSA